MLNKASRLHRPSSCVLTTLGARCRGCKPGPVALIFYVIFLGEALEHTSWSMSSGLPRSHQHKLTLQALVHAGLDSLNLFDQVHYVVLVCQPYRCQHVGATDLKHSEPSYINRAFLQVSATT